MVSQRVAGNRAVVALVSSDATKEVRMFCHVCGARLEPSARFCPSCGQSVSGAPPISAPSRIARHVRALGIWWLALSAFHLLPGLALLSVFGHGPHFWWPGPPEFVFPFVRIFSILFIAGGILGIVAGWGLLDRQPWARTLALILGFLNLIHFPFGTALGIYTLWVLLPAESEQEYRTIARAA